MRRYVQLFQQCRDTCSAAVVGIDAAAADFAIPARKDVLGKAAQELRAFDCHLLLAALIGVVLVIEGDPMAAVDAADALVGYGYCVFRRY